MKTCLGQKVGVFFTLFISVFALVVLLAPSALGAGNTPTISTHPQSQTNYPGADVSFSVVASGAGTLSYQWMFNGTNLVNSAHIGGATSATLTVSNVGYGDLGSYQVLVSNSHGSILSSNAGLRVQWVVAWGTNSQGQVDVPASASNVVAVAAGHGSVALRADGTVVAWGAPEYISTSVPMTLSNVVSVTTGEAGQMILLGNGKVVTLGNLVAPPSNLSNVVAVAGALNLVPSWVHAIALKNDGTVVEWNSSGQEVIGGTASTLSNIVAVAAGSCCFLALKSDGTVAGWGNGSFGTLDIPADLNQVVDIGSGYYSSLALKANGDLTGWGSDSYWIVSKASNVHNVAAFCYTRWNVLALLNDGTLSAWGDDQFGQSSVPAGLTNVMAVTGDENHSLAIQGWRKPPLIYQQPAGFTALAEQSVLFKASAVGNVPLRYQWRINGTNIDGATASTLLLTNVRPSQTGLYSVSITNFFGVVSSSNAVLAVAAAIITNQPQSQTNIPGSIATFTVAAKSPVPLSYQWWFNNSPLAGQTNSSLMVGNVHGGDAGNYYVVLTNAYGVVTSAVATLTLDYVSVVVAGQAANGALNPPSAATNLVAMDAGFSEVSSTCLGLRADGTMVNWGQASAVETNFPPEATNIVAISVGGPNQGGSFSVALRADGKVFAWGKDDFGQGQTNVPADLADVVAVSAGGNYAVALRADGTLTGWGENSSGQRSFYPGTADGVIAIAAGNFHTLGLRSDGTLAAWGGNLNGQLSVPAGATDLIAIAAGGNHSLVLRADGRVLTWGWIGSYVPPEATNVVAIAAGAFHNLALRSDGRIIAWGDNTYGELGITNVFFPASAVAAGGNLSMALVRETATPSAPRLLKVPAANTIIAGNTLLLEPGALGSPPLKYQWLLNGTALTGQTNHLLALRNIQLTQAGDYQVIVANDHGTLTGLVSTVTVHAPPVILAAPTNQTIVIGSNVTFQASVSGFPVPGLRWQKNGADLFDDARISGTDTLSLSIHGIQTNDAGNYWIVASNSVAVATSMQATLTVVGPPFIASHPASQTIPAGSNVTFSVQASGTGTLSYQWRLSQTNLTGKTQTTLALTNVQSANAGDYDVMVSNAYGVVTSLSATLTVTPSAPWLTLQPTSHVASVGATVTFGVQASGSSPIGYQWQLNGTNLPGMTNFSLSLTNVHYGEVGVYRALLTNSVNDVFSSDATLTVVPVIGWGGGTLYGVSNVPPAATNVVAIAAGAPGSGSPCLALRADGVLVGWGYDFKAALIPASATNVVTMAIGGGLTPNEPQAHNLAVLASGSVLAWGANNYGQTNAPATATNIVAVAAGGGHCLALKENGDLLTWGNTNSNLAIIPPAATNVIAVAAGTSHSLALRADGTVMAWGSGTYGQTNVPLTITNIVAIAACGDLSLALRADGTVLGWGGLRPPAIPASATNIVAIAVGTYHELGLGANRSILGWGNNFAGQVMPPAYTSNVVAIAAGGIQSLALVADPFAPPIPPRIARLPASRIVVAGQPYVFNAVAIGGLPLTYQWLRDGMPVNGQTRSSLIFTNALPGDEGDFQLVAMNSFGAVTSTVVAVTVNIPQPMMKSAVCSSGTFSFNMDDIPGVLYIVEYRDSLEAGMWLELESRLGNGGTETIMDTNSLPQTRFYRVRAIYPPPP